MEFVGPCDECVEQDRRRRRRAVEVDLVARADDGHRLGRGHDAHDDSLRGGGRVRDVPWGRVGTCLSGLPPNRAMVWTHDMASHTLPEPHTRPIDQTDCEALSAFYVGLSPESRESRFHGTAAGIGGRTARYLCGPDHGHREGFVAEVVDGGGRRVIVGHVCIEPTGTGEAEMAIAVADAWQRHGIGRAAARRGDRLGPRRTPSSGWSPRSASGTARSSVLSGRWIERSRWVPATVARSTSRSTWATRRAARSLPDAGETRSDQSPGATTLSTSPVLPTGPRFVRVNT